MIASNRLLNARKAMFVLAASLAISACGGGSGGTGSSNENPAVPTPTTGTLGIVFTDKATDEFDSIKLSINEAVLLSDDGQHVVFDELQEVDLLDLENFMEPIFFGEVPTGTYSKLRLRIGEIELMPKGGNPGDEIYPPLPANGKIDLLDPSGIPILPGRALLVELDMEANKAFKVTTAGKSTRVNVRPVVKTTFYTGEIPGGLPDKLIRFEGIIAEIYTDPAGAFRLCDIDMPASCIDIETAMDTSVFRADGTDGLFSDLIETDDVVVIGRYRFEEGLNDGTSTPRITAFIIEKDIATSAQFTGQVVSAPAEGQFLFVGDDGAATDYLVELQAGTKFFDMNAEPPMGSDGSSIGVGTDLEIEGVAVAGSPDLLRAALVLITADEDEQLNGTIIADSIVAEDRTLQVDPGEGADPVNVYVNEDAVVLFIDTATSTVTTGSFEQLAAGQVIELFGETVTLEDMSTRFEANEILVDGPPPASE